MGQDSSEYVQRAVIRLIKGGPGVTALVPAARIYPPEAPHELVWPYILYGSDIVVPFVAGGIDGIEITVAIHAFAKTTTTGGQAYVKRINAALASLLGGKEGRGISIPISVPSPYPAGIDTDAPHSDNADFSDDAEYDGPEIPDASYAGRARIFVTGSQCFRDGSEAGAWHGVTNLRIVADTRSTEFRP